MRARNVTDVYLFGQSSSNQNEVSAFFVILDGEVEEFHFFKSEADAHAANAAWLSQWAAENDVDSEGMGQDDLADAAFDEGYECHVQSGVIE